MSLYSTNPPPERRPPINLDILSRPMGVRNREVQLYLPMHQLLPTNSQTKYIDSLKISNSSTILTQYRESLQFCQYALQPQTIIRKILCQSHSTQQLHLQLVRDLVDGGDTFHQLWNGLRDLVNVLKYNRLTGSVGLEQRATLYGEHMHSHMCMCIDTVMLFIQTLSSN